MRTFDDVFEAFGGPFALAKEIGVKTYHANLMARRGSIPPTYWLATVEAAKRLNISGVTLEFLASLVAKNVPSALPAPEPARAAE